MHDSRQFHIKPDIAAVQSRLVDLHGNNVPPLPQR
jgi:hypothetical protein